MREHIGKAEQGAVPIFGFRKRQLLLHLLNLLLVGTNQCDVERIGRRSLILLNPEHEIHLAAFQFLLHDLAHFHLLLSIDGSDARGDVERLAIQRLDLCMNLLSVVLYDALAVACH